MSFYTRFLPTYFVHGNATDEYVCGQMEEEIEQVEFQSYVPTKLMKVIPDAKPHPDKVVENATLAAVEARGRAF